MWRNRLLSGLVAWLAAAAPAQAYDAYVSNEKSNTVSVIDTDSWTVTKTIKVGQRPRGIEFTRDGKFVFVAVGDDDTIQVIDAAKQQVVDSLPSGPDPELFALAAFKGQKLTLRDWNQQLRQPILLSDGRTVVSVSPQQEFLHQVSELDTLGVDRPETKCKLK